MKSLRWQRWSGLSSIDAHSFMCGHCGKETGTNHGYFYSDSPSNIRVLICTYCGNPTYINYGEQTPGPIQGKDIKNLPDDIEKIYLEIRNDIKSGSDTSASLLGRKLIMHIAVDIAGAEEGESFVSYINHLKSSNYLPPNADKLLEFLRELGNEKNHEIKFSTAEDSIKILSFIEALLYFVYELGDIKTADSD